MSPRNVWPAVVLAIAAMGIIAGMAVAKVEKDTIVLIASMLATPVLAGLLAAQGAANTQGVQQLQAQTNGNQARMIDVVDRLGHLLAAAPAVPAETIPAQPTSSTTPPTSS